MTESQIDSAIAPKAAHLVRVTPERVEFLTTDGVVGMQRRTSPNLEIALTTPAPDGQLQAAVDHSQTQLVLNISKALESTMKRVGSSFSWHLGMSVAVFAVGLSSFAFAVFKGVNSPGTSDAIVSAAFGGLTAATFIAYFISRPTAAVASAGPEAAWLLGMVNTYWTKLIYLNNPSTFVRDIEAAQKDFEDSMTLFLKTAKYQARAEPVEDEAGAPGDGKKQEGHGKTSGKAPEKKTEAKQPAKKQPAKKQPSKHAEDNANGTRRQPARLAVGDPVEGPGPNGAKDGLA